jgi:hypothetical protein
MEKRKTSKKETKEPVAVKEPKIKTELNHLGYPLSDPYGLVAAFCNEKAPMTVFNG